MQSRARWATAAGSEAIFGFRAGTGSGALGWVGAIDATTLEGDRLYKRSSSHAFTLDAEEEICS
jgi:hypothetical protein